MGLEPIRSPIRPSNVRVCRFRHDRKTRVAHATASIIILAAQLLVNMKLCIHGGVGGIVQIARRFKQEDAEIAAF